jgi:hypothetical protein
MALTMDELRQLIEGLNFPYLIDPKRPALRANVRGDHGSYDFALILHDDGRFLQLRTVSYGSCPSDHRHLPMLLHVLGDLNYVLRYLKFGWDSNDGEIVGYGDTWVQDAKLTPLQFHAIFWSFVVGVDKWSPRITQAIQTGKDIGREEPSSADIQTL